MLYILETSNPEQTDTSMANNEEVTGLPLSCDQSRQAENVQDMTKVPLYHQKKTYSRIKKQLCQANTKKKQKFYILSIHFTDS